MDIFRTSSGPVPPPPAHELATSVPPIPPMCAVSGLTSCFASHVSPPVRPARRCCRYASVDCFHDCSNTPTQSARGHTQKPHRPRCPTSYHRRYVAGPTRREQGPHEAPPPRRRRRRRVGGSGPLGKTAARGRLAAFRVEARGRQHLSPLHSHLT